MTHQGQRRAFQEHATAQDPQKELNNDIGPLAKTKIRDRAKMMFGVKINLSNPGLTILLQGASLARAGSGL